MKEGIHPTVSDFMRQNGRKGALVRKLTPQDRARGVAVRLKKAELIRNGFSEQEALRRARALVGKQP